jgi:hypothetical protein
VARKALPSDPVAGVYGILSLGESTDEVIGALRGSPDTV